MTSVSGAVKTINLPPSAGPSASSGSLAEGKFIFDWCENISGLPGRVKQFVKGFETERPARWETSLNVRSPARTGGQAEVVWACAWPSLAWAADHAQLASRDLHRLRRIIHPARFVNAAVVQRALDHFVPEQCNNSPAHEQRTPIAVPIDTRRAARIVNCLLGLRGEFANLFKVQAVVAQEKNCG